MDGARGALLIITGLKHLEIRDMSEGGEGEGGGEGDQGEGGGEGD